MKVKLAALRLISLFSHQKPRWEAIFMIFENFWLMLANNSIKSQ